MDNNTNEVVLVPENKQELKYEALQKNDGLIIGAAALLTAALYSLCFTGKLIFPGLSLTVFCAAVIVIFYVLCRMLNRVKNSKGFFWALPIMAISLFHSVFQLSLLHYLNVIAVHYLFAVMAVKVTKDRDANTDIYNFALRVLSCIFNNVIKAFPIFSLFIKKGETKSKLAKIALACVMSLPVIIVVFILLIDADQVFSFYSNRFFDSFFSSNNNFINHIIAIILATVYFTAYGYNLFYKKSTLLNKPTAKGDPLMLGTFLTMLNLLFAAFCVVQLVFLFSGGYMRLPEGIVYSEYARSGFFQLLFVTIINFTVIILSIEVFQASIQYRFLKNLLFLLCVFTGVLICSSFYRMGLYIQAYHYTVLRLQVLTFLGMESVLLIATMLYLWKRNFILLKYYAYIILVFFLAVNYTGTNYYADKLNIQAYYREYRPEKLDLKYFSIDGAPMLLAVYDDPSTDPVLREKIHDRLFQIYQEYLTYEKYNSCWQNFSYYKNKGFKTLSRL